MKIGMTIVCIVLLVGAAWANQVGDVQTTENHLLDGVDARFMPKNPEELEKAADNDWRKNQIKRGILTPAPVLIAVCDVAKVQAAYKAGVARSAAWENAVKQAKAKVQGTVAAIVKLQAQLDAMKKKRGKEYEKLVTAIATATANNQAYARVRSKELDDMRTQAQQANRDAQEHAVETVAKRHSTELVIPTSIAIYSTKAMDITAEVVEEINK